MALRRRHLFVLCVMNLTIRWAGTIAEVISPVGLIHCSVRKANTLETVTHFLNNKIYSFAESSPPSFLHKSLNPASFVSRTLPDPFLFTKPLFFFLLQQFVHNTHQRQAKYFYLIYFYYNHVSCLSTSLFRLLISFHIKYQMFIMASTPAGNLAKMQWGWQISKM